MDQPVQELDVSGVLIELEKKNENLTIELYSGNQLVGLFQLASQQKITAVVVSTSRGENAPNP